MPIRLARYPAAAWRGWASGTRADSVDIPPPFFSRGTGSQLLWPWCHKTRPALGSCAHALAHILRNRAANPPIRALLEALVCAQCRWTERESGMESVRKTCVPLGDGHLTRRCSPHVNERSLQVPLRASEIMAETPKTAMDPGEKLWLSSKKARLQKKPRDPR